MDDSYESSGPIAHPQSRQHSARPALCVRGLSPWRLPYSAVSDHQNIAVFDYVLFAFEFELGLFS